ncbi:putative serine protease K12H4.7 [Petromyzon marinus]|uniref:putative serine protease K12H4.7 n=1 Tax=Petromyzon marinus TaxID=7757 RepID=UPI003F6EBF4B
MASLCISARGRRSALALPSPSPLLPLLLLLLLLCCGCSCWGQLRGAASGSQPSRWRWWRRPPVAAPEASAGLWFQQRLDHFNAADARLWSQRYFMNDTFHKPGGPVLLMVGGEGPANVAWMCQGTWLEYARRLGAMCLMLEHRFYGQSHPTANVSVENLRHLSSEQALADLAHFRREVSVALPRLAGAKWVAVGGGSYPGSLAAWLRLKYPHLVHSAIASSAPLNVTVNFPEYLEVLRRSLEAYDVQCAASVKEASDRAVQLLGEKQYEKIGKDFGLCEPLDVRSDADSAYLLETLAGFFMDVVQYNEDNRAFEGAKGTNVTISVLCAVMRDAALGGAYERYAAAVRLTSDALGVPCVDASYTGFLRDMRGHSWDGPAVASGGRQWVYQTCTEFGFYQTTDSAQQPFSGFPLSYKLQQCADVYGPEFDAAAVAAAVQRTNEDYGGLALRASRIVFPNGSLDPWHALGATRDLAADLPAVFIQGTAHCANMYPATAQDPPQLTEARARVFDILQKWLSEDD